MPTRLAWPRAARTRTPASSTPAPNLPVSASTAPSPGTARRTNSSRSVAPPVAATILASSSGWSSTNRRTPCSWYASAIAPRPLTGCMKWHLAPGSSDRTARTSPIEAVSNARTPPSHKARSTSGASLHLTA